jgi:hypothetical protein
MNIKTDNSAVIATLNKRIENLERYNAGLANESCSQQARIAELEEERNDSVIYFVDFCIEKQGLNKSGIEAAFMYWVKELKDQSNG